jgi:hypothetical protein
VVVANSTAFGSVFVPHLFLNANQNVLVECRLDPLCVGDWNQTQPASSDENAKPALSWTITLQASVAGLTVSKDFRQIDMFGAIKAEWETSNPGRAEKAKAARAKYLNPPAVDPALEFTINNNTGEQPTQPVVKTAKAPVEVGLNAPVAQLTAELSQQRADALKERAEQSNQEKERAAQRRQAELEYRLDAVAKQWISDAQVHFFFYLVLSIFFIGSDIVLVQLNRAALLERRTKENGERAAYLQRFQAFDAAVMQLRAAVMVCSIFLILFCV